MENEIYAAIEGTENLEEASDSVISGMANAEANTSELTTESTEATTENTESFDEEKEALLSEISRLKAEIEAKEAERSRIVSELEIFERLFPDASINSLPKSVWEQVEKGIPLSAAYALYEKEESLKKNMAEAKNRLNASLSAGRAGNESPSEYFSPDEVRRMSQKEVHENYNIIRKSMKHWH